MKTLTKPRANNSLKGMVPYVIKDTDLFLDTTSAEKDYILKIHDLPSESKPRERLIKQGPETLSLAGAFDRHS